jgi:UDP-2,3-diacylglucosamine pyrophosphatase LpxH
MKLFRTLLAAVSLLALVGGACADSWKFIVTGDGRSGKNRPEDHNGVNTVIMTELAKAMIAENPKFVLFSGDLVAGPKTDAEMESQLATWLETMKPVYDAGIKVYNIRGNHEMHVPHPEAVWRKMFVGPYAMPENGPKGEEGMSFTVSYQNVLVIGLDEFQTKELHVNQAWLSDVLKNKKEQHVFVYSHKMAFRSGNHDDGLEIDPPSRDALIKSLIAAGARTVFFGHDHLYDHRAVTAPGDPPSKTLHQFVIGTAGAPLVHGTDDPGNNSDWKVDKIKHIEDKYGYAVVEIDGPKVTITFKARSAPGVYEPADTFSYTVG